MSLRNLAFVSVAATLAAGILAFSAPGCTVTSGDSDGGTSSGGSSSSSSSGGSSSGSSGDGGGSSSSSSGSSSGDGGKCAAESVISLGATCDTCAFGKCCTELSACFKYDGTEPDGGAKASDCMKYSDCVDECDKTADPAGCVATTCSAYGATAAAQYKSANDCLANKCNTECQ